MKIRKYLFIPLALLFLGLTPLAHAAPAVVQTCANGAFNTSGNCTFSSNVTNGDVLVAVTNVSQPFGTAISGCVTWTTVASTTGAQTYPYENIAIGTATSTAACTLTSSVATTSAAVILIDAWELSGVQSTTDGSAFGGVNYGTSWYEGPPIDAAYNHDIVLSAINAQSSAQTYTSSTFAVDFEGVSAAGTLEFLAHQTESTPGPAAIGYVASTTLASYDTQAIVAIPATGATTSSPSGIFIAQISPLSVKPNEAINNTASTTLSFGNLPRAGDLIMVAIAENNDGNVGIKSIVDNQTGNTYVPALVVTTTANTPYGGLYYYYAKNIGTPSGNFTVTVTANSATYMDVGMYDIRNADPTNPIPAGNATSTNAGSGTSALTGTVTPGTTALFIGDITGNGANVSPLTPPSGWNSRWLEPNGAAVATLNTIDVVSSTANSTAWTISSQAYLTGLVAVNQAAAAVSNSPIINSSSTDFFLRGEYGSIFGNSVSTDFSLFNSGQALALPLMSSTDFEIISGIIRPIFQPVKPNYTLIHYQWRNDDGSETGATSATGGIEDTPLTGLAASTSIRLRTEITNNGGTILAYSPQSFQLQYGTLSTTCSAISTWTAVGASGAVWSMYNSSNISDGSSTTDIATSTGGVLDMNHTFITPNYGVKTTTSTVAAISVPSDSFIDMEFDIRALSSSTGGATYCFRLTNVGSANNFTYTQYPQATLANPSITLGNGTEPAPVTVAPGAVATTTDAFTFTTAAGTSTITNVTTTISTVNGVGLVEITNASGTVVYGSSTNYVVTPLTLPSTTLSISLTGMNVSSTPTTFLLLVQPKNLSSMPVTSGNYVVTSTITAWSDALSEPQAGSNTTSSAVTIANPGGITLGNGTEPAPVTIGPGSSATTTDIFTFTTASGTSTITNVTTTLATTTGVGLVEITNASGTTIFGSSTNLVASSSVFASTTISIPVSAMNVSTTATTFQILMQPKNFASMPTGTRQGMYAVSSTVTGWTDALGLPQAGANTTSSVVTIDNQPPNPVTNASGTVGTSQVTLSWTNPTSTYFAGTLVLRTSSTPPINGIATSTTYGIGTSTDPVGIAFDGTNMWMTDGGAQAVTKISPTGVTTTYIIGAALGPIAIAFDGTNMWTADVGNSVTKISPTGATTTYSIGASTQPYGIAFDGTNMWTADHANNSVTKISPTGLVFSYGIGVGTVPYDIAFDGINMWTADSSGQAVTKISPTGVTTTYSIGSRSPYGIAFDGTNMWTANYSDNSVTKISPTGTATTYNIGASTDPLAIAFDGINMWTANEGNNSVTKISPTGATTTYFITGLNVPEGLAFDGTGDIWVTNYVGNSVTEITPSYRYDTPTNGTTYTVGQTIGSSTVACVVASSTSSCTDTGLTNGTKYYYQIFAQDAFTNYSTGVTPTGSPFTPGSSQTITLTLNTSTVTLPSLTPGINVSATTTATVNVTGATGGFTLSINRNSATSTIASGTIAFPDYTAWAPSGSTCASGQGNGTTTPGTNFSFRVASSGTSANYCSFWWGASDSGGTAIYAGVPTSSQIIVNSTSSASQNGTTTVTILYSANAPGSQRATSYTGSVTITAIANP